ncbi:MAG TPA: hypothetical protein VGM77_11140 [Gemmatimonadales bacterium]|jgi:hypothetical protein
MPPALMIANVIRFYGYETWQNAHYETSDQIIPFGRFMMLYRAMPNVQALERINHTWAATNAIAACNGVEASVVTKMQQRDLEEAYGKEQNG